MCSAVSPRAPRASISERASSALSRRSFAAPYRIAQRRRVERRRAVGQRRVALIIVFQQPSHGSNITGNGHPEERPDDACSATENATP